MACLPKVQNEESNSVMSYVNPYKTQDSELAESDIVNSTTEQVIAISEKSSNIKSTNLDDDAISEESSSLSEQDEDICDELYSQITTEQEIFEGLVPDNAPFEQSVEKCEYDFVFWPSDTENDNNTFDGEDVYRHRKRNFQPAIQSFAKVTLEDKENQRIHGHAQMMKLSRRVFRQDITISPNDFSCGKNRIALLGSNKVITLLEMNYDIAPVRLFPYKCSQIDVPQDQPYASIFKTVCYESIYKNSNIYERQELTLDPFYISNCSIALVPARVVQVLWIPKVTLKSEGYAVVLNSFGFIQVYRQSYDFSRWEKVDCNINKVLSEDVFPADFSTVHNYKLFKEAFNKLRITSMVADADECPGYVHFTTESGHIVTLKVAEDFSSCSPLGVFKSTMLRICFSKLYNGIMIVTSMSGLVKVYRVNCTPETVIVTELETIWDYEDNLVVTIMDIQKCEELNNFVVVFAKADSIIVCLLSKDGKLVSRVMQKVGSVQITGIAAYTSKDFIVTAFTGKITRYEVIFSDKGEIKLKENVTKHNLKLRKQLILGVARTEHKNLFTLVTYRNRTISYLCDTPNDAVFVTVCNIRPLNYVSLLRKIDINSIETYIDVIRGVFMNLSFYVDFNDFHAFYELKNSIVPDVFDTEYQRIIQLQFIVVKTLVLVQSKCKYPLYDTIDYFEFYRRAIEVIHCLNRLKCLKQKQSNGTLTDFGALSGACMKTKLDNVLVELESQALNEKLLFTETIRKFINSARKQLVPAYNIEYPNMENCCYCDVAVVPGTSKCSNGHFMQRCSLSNMQMPIVGRQFCFTCHLLILDVSYLKDLYSASESIYCLQCRMIIGPSKFEVVPEFP